MDAHRREKPNEALVGEPAAVERAEDARLETMRLAIGDLPDVLRETLRLKLAHDLSYDELAEVMAVPIGTIRSRLHHAVRTLRGVMRGNAD
jgi:RNA polymerase sigma-70 factor (ECF subfamily)